jgi:hypothetical protein
MARPYALSQRHLLSERDFAAEISRRGLTVSATETLERLARDRVLVPAIKVSKPVRNLRVQARNLVDWQRRQILDSSPPTTAPGLLELVSDGLVEATAEGPSRPWRQRQRQEGGLSFRAFDFLYSPYQLLLAPTVSRLTSELLTWHGSAKTKDLAAMSLDRAKQAAAASDSEVGLLTALEPIYYPRIVGRITMPTEYGNFEGYEAWTQSFDPGEYYRWLDWDHGELLKLAERYINVAHSIDPLQRWIELVRLIDPSQWDKLEGHARLAIDLRIGADMILRFLEDLSARGVVPALPVIPPRAPHPLQWRLKADRTTLDETLLDYGLSPYPALLLVVEGSCEEEIVPRVMHVLGIPIRDDFIKILTLGGVAKKPELLARYLAPSLRRIDAHHAEFLRPPARVLVVADAEGGYSTASNRMARRHDWIRPAFDSLDPAFQTPAARIDMEGLVTVTTWTNAPNRSCFEFAHATDLQLARAILATGKAPPGVMLQSVRADLANCRRQKTNWKSVWKSWPDPKPGKLEVWEHLWPVLERKIERSAAAGRHNRNPVVRVVLEAYELASGPRHVVLRLM